MQAEIYWIDPEHTLAIMPRPRAGDWLEDEIASWQRSGTDVIVSLLEPMEVEELGLAPEEEMCVQAGLEFLSFPIPDRGVPSEKTEFGEFLSRLHQLRSLGKRIGIHCRIGVGRSAMVAACLLVQDGMEVDSAFELIETARGLSVPDTKEQIESVRQLSQNLKSQT